MIELKLEEVLASPFSPHITLMTPNRRLSATLHKHYREMCLRKNQQVWLRPDILPVTTWLERLWTDFIGQTFNAEPRLLNLTQEQFLWQSVIANTDQEDFILQIAETAELARGAFALLKQWQVTLTPEAFNLSQDYLIFYRWATDFLQKCQQKNVFDQASLTDWVTKKILSTEIKPPAQIMLFGFTTLTPQLTACFNACEQKGSRLYYLTAKKKKSHVKRIGLRDQPSQIITMARFSKAIFDEDKTRTVACVFPTLEQHREQILRIFSEVFADDLENLSPFNLSAGKSLLQYPVIKTALQLLGLYNKKIASASFTYLLFSPFLGEAETEYDKRANVDRLLRQQNINEIDLTALLSSSSDTLTLETTCPLLAKRLHQFFKLLDDQKKFLTFHEWANFFNELLIALGWPGERSLNSEEYQTVENWLTLFTTFASLDQISPAVNFYQALHALQEITKRHTFQPQTPDAPIQILGLLEAAALPFDYLWIADMDDFSWPPSPKPNPFIPKTLQRQLAMPHSSSEREFVYCQQLTTQFKESAETVIFSHLSSRDELPLRESPLISDIPQCELAQLNLAPQQLLTEKIFSKRALQFYLDDKAPALLPNETVRGGVNIIKHQAACPFKAFAEWRLHAKGLEEALPGLRAKERGTLTHLILEKIWQKLGDQASLLAASYEQLISLINCCIDESFTILLKFHNKKSSYFSLEKKRLLKLIHEWLILEKNRQPFKVVTQEKMATLTLNKLHLSFRIDRIDELADGRRIIIDYKTGKYNDIASWFSERPDEPQLPLYALFDKENTAAICFAQIATGNYEFKGISHELLTMEGVKTLADIKYTEKETWSAQLMAWQELFLKLADDFYHGIATVNPKQPGQTCLWCELTPLCRINEEISQ